MPHEHDYAARLVWTGAERGSTRDYRSYSRDYRVEVEGKPVLTGSADPTFLGDASKHNPEDLLVASLAACHMLTFLAECARAGIEVVAYEDQARGKMAFKERKMRFVEVTLAPQVTIAAGDLAQAEALHAQAHDGCFIASSVNFPVRHTATVRRA